MADVTEIGWCDRTHNEWIGCAKKSRGCRFCYAEADERRWNPDRSGRRTATTWGRNSPRRLTTLANRRKPYTWNRKAQAAGVPARVFAASKADVFEEHWMLPPWREGLFGTIEATPWLRWMLLTKRIELVEAMTAARWGKTWPSNVWLGTSVEGQAEADERLPILLNLEGPAERFVSAEPLLELMVVGGHLNKARYPLSLLIVGGESGRKARPMHPDWALSLRDESTAAGVPFMFKQWGEFAPYGCGQDTAAGVRGPVTLLAPDASRHNPAYPGLAPTGCVQLARYGKTRSGRVLDGRTYDGVVASWAAEVAAAGRPLEVACG